MKVLYGYNTLRASLTIMVEAATLFITESINPGRVWAATCHPLRWLKAALRFGKQSTAVDRLVVWWYVRHIGPVPYRTSTKWYGVPVRTTITHSLDSNAIIRSCPL